MSTEIIKLAKDALLDELTSAQIYRKIAKLHRQKEIKQKLETIAKIEEEHAEYWKRFLEKRGQKTEDIKPSNLKTIPYTLLLRILGLGLTLKLLEIGEREAVQLYSKILESPDLTHAERQQLIKILEDELVHEEEFTKQEKQFTEFINHVRDAVLGMNDGLVEILSVTTGLAGAYGNPFHVALGGLIVGIAGALSMGIGAYISTRAQRKVQEGIIGRIKTATQYVAHLFQKRVKRYMIQKGYTTETSEKIASEASTNKNLLARIIAEEEYGIKEETLENPAKVGTYTGIFYMIGAFIPLTPYFMNIPIQASITLSLTLAATALAATGFLIALSADIPIKRNIAEMTLSGLGSATITYIIGRITSSIFGIQVT